MLFNIEDLRKDKNFEGKWWFSVTFYPLNRCGHLKSNGWRYYEESTQIRRPSAKTFAGNITNIDDDSLELLKEFVTTEIRARQSPIQLRSIAVYLNEKYKASGGEWKEVFSQIDEEMDGLKNANSSSQVVAYLAAACLARIKPSLDEDVFPNDVTLPITYR